MEDQKHQKKMIDFFSEIVKHYVGDDCFKTELIIENFETSHFWFFWPEKYAVWVFFTTNQLFRKLDYRVSCFRIEQFD